MRSVRSLAGAVRRRLVRMVRGPISAPLELASPEEYWSQHTVHVSDSYLASADASLRYFHWRCDQYPGYLDLMPVSGLDGMDVVDYGCGPGHDLVGIATYSRPTTLIGLDVSDRALQIAQKRLSLHGFQPSIHLRKLNGGGIPLPDSSVDYIHCSGVLHHVPDPVAILEEFSRILRPEGRVRVMVYNQESLWWHLYIPYVMQIRKRTIDPGVPLPIAFRMSTDGFECPIAESYTVQSFAALAERAGFTTNLAGTSISQTEIDAWKRYGTEALDDRRLNRVHKQFLREIEVGSNGELLRRSQRPGIGLVLQLTS